MTIRCQSKPDIRAQTAIYLVSTWKTCASMPQQAAEKAIKAVMITHGIDFPYIHDLAHLVMILESRGEPIPDTVRHAVKLTRYAIHTRYPGLEEPVSEEEHREAVAIAEAVVQWAEERL